jgi:hypothetical protein
MRVASAVLVIGVLWAGVAEASSFVVLPAMTDKLGPSMIALGQTATPDVTVAAAIPEPAQPPIVEPGQIKILSPSIIALGEPAVTSESVAAIGMQTNKPGPNTMPMVIRGGMAGDAFSPAAASAPVASEDKNEPEQQTAAQTPSSEVAGKPAPYPPPAAPMAPAIKPQ